MTDYKNMEFDGEVVAKHESTKILTKKDGGTYFVHSFVVKIDSETFGDYVKEISVAFKTVQSNVIANVHLGDTVRVKCSMEPRAWFDKEAKSYKIKEDNFSGAETFAHFMDPFYAYGVDVLKESGAEENLEKNQSFEKGMGAATPEPESDLPF